jgi:uncharacterized protein (DUF58 family)
MVAEDPMPAGGGTVRGRPETPQIAAGVTTRELARATRLLSVRSLREATGLFAGNYVSAFRGGGLEFEESRPYVAGDDVRSIDWITMARTGVPYVKRFREERNHTLVFVLDNSASMAFGTAGPSKAAVAVHTLALMAAAAARAGDQTRLLVIDEGVRSRVPSGRGRAHTWHVIRSAAEAAARPQGATRLAAGLRELRAERRSTLVLLSDFRDPQMFADTGGGDLPAALAALTRRCDVVAAGIVDPREESLPQAGRIRLTDPENPTDTWVIDTGSARARQRYRDACAARRRRVDGELRRSGAEPVWMRCDRNPLYALGRFFHERSIRRRFATA